MRAHAAAFDVAQFVRERLAHHLHARLRDIVGGVSGWTGNALLRARVDDRGQGSLLDHVWRESLHAVDHAPEIDVENAPPTGRIAEQVPAPARASVVHEYGDLAERVIDRGLQALDVVAAGDVDGEGSNRIRLRRSGADLCGAGFEGVAAQVRHT